MYQNYVFDFYGTLADIRTDEEDPQLWKKMSEIYGALGAAYGAGELQRAFRRLEEAEKERLGTERLHAGNGRKKGRPEPEETEPEGIEPEETEPEGIETEGNEPEGIESEGSEPGGIEPEGSEPEGIGPERSEPEGIESQGIELEGIEAERVKPEGIALEEVEPDLTKVFALLYHEKNVLCDASQARLTAITFRALSRKFLRAYDGVEELLGALKSCGKRVYLLSNAQTDFTRPEIEMLGLTRYFDGIFLSSEQGCKKPSPVFFRRLLEQYGLEPSESIMIGNDEAADIAGARNVGMDALYIHTDISPKEYGKVRATFRVMDGDFRKIGGLILKR